MFTPFLFLSILIAELYQFNREIRQESFQPFSACGCPLVNVPAPFWDILKVDAWVTDSWLPVPRLVKPAGRKEEHMLWTIVAILLVLWLLGLVSSYTMGGLIHILLVVAIVVVILNLIQGRRSL